MRKISVNKVDVSDRIRKPINTLQKAISKNARVKLKSGIEYKGKISNVDAYMNVVLTDAEEYDEGSLSANFGKVVIRGSYVLFIAIEPDIQVI